jgi:hypothetical protein
MGVRGQAARTAWSSGHSRPRRSARARPSTERLACPEREPAQTRRAAEERAGATKPAPRRLPGPAASDRTRPSIPDGPAPRGTAYPPLRRSLLAPLPHADNVVAARPSTACRRRAPPVRRPRVASRAALRRRLTWLTRHCDRRDSRDRHPTGAPASRPRPCRRGHRPWDMSRKSCPEAGSCSGLSASGLVPCPGSTDVASRRDRRRWRGGEAKLYSLVLRASPSVASGDETKRGGISRPRARH